MTHHEYLIVGAGPAGLQLGYHLGNAGRDYLILEANDRAGSFFVEQPRHRLLISINKRFNYFPDADYNMRHDWNSLLTDDDSHLFRNYSEELYPKADDIVRYLGDFAAKYDIRIKYNSRVQNIAKAEGNHTNLKVTDINGEEYTCRHLIMATGPCRPRIPEHIDGIELAEGYEDHDIDPKRFENKQVAIIGGGNSAFEVANHLAGHAALIHLLIGNRLIRHAWQTHFVGDLRAINNTVLDMYQLKSLHAALAQDVRKIEKLDDGRFAVYVDAEAPHWSTPGTVSKMKIFDHVIRCTGWRYIDPELFEPDVLPEACPKGKYPVLNDRWESTVPNLYFIGTSMAARDKKSASGFIHGFRYNVRTLFHMMERRFHGVDLPADEFQLETTEDLEALTEHIIKRVSTTSALYQLYGFLGDVLILSPGKAKLVYEQPMARIEADKEGEFGSERIAITLEFGFHRYPEGSNTMDFIHPAPGPDCAAFLHPVFRHFSDGQLVNNANLDESIFVRHDPESYDPAEGSTRPAVSKHLVMKFIGDATGIDAGDEPQAPLYDANGVRRFTPWEPDDPRTINHGVPVCESEITNLAPKAKADVNQ